jgi:prolyl-tRNA editing enzyme YbaK/EbsC (Cys-tRNA(Pro) deacylase)
MSYSKAKQYLEEKGLGDRLTVHNESIDTVEHAAQQIGCSEAEIAKTQSSPYLCVNYL